jgi:hypothetical protein
MRTYRGYAAGLFLSGVMIATGSLTALAGTTGNQGCTPGYWKNHTSNWPVAGVTTTTETDTIVSTQSVGSIFNSAPAPLNGNTLLQALQYQGGSTLLAAKQILLRAAVAAYLNAADDRMGYPLRRSGPNGIVAQVNAALASTDRNAILALASTLDKLNNLGCPLN